MNNHELDIHNMYISTPYIKDIIRWPE